MDKKILLVADDDEMNRRIISKFLKNDYTIIEAENGKRAMEQLETSPVDVLLLDIIMPEMDGLEVLKEIQEKEAFSNVGILVATSTKEKTERTALSLGADDVVSKPYDPMVIKKRLQNILAVKELGKRGKLLASSDYESLKAEYRKELNKQVEAVMKQIQSCIKIINSNKENYALVAEMTEEIRRLSEETIKQISSEE